MPIAPHTKYVAESVFVTDDPTLVASFKTKFDDYWTNTTSFANYANVVQRSRVYPTFPVDSELNFPPEQSFSSRAVSAYNAEETVVLIAGANAWTDLLLEGRRKDDGDQDRLVVGLDVQPLGSERGTAIMRQCRTFSIRCRSAR